MVNKILFITLSNIGDVILTLPALDILRLNFPEAKITVIAGPRTKEIFQNNPAIHEYIEFDKHAPLGEKIKLFNVLKDKRFDIVADLRNTFYGLFLPAKYRISVSPRVPKSIVHMKERHLFKILNSKLQIPNKSQTQDSNIQNKTIFIGPQDEEYVKNILYENDIKEADSIIIIAPGARSHLKRWDKDAFAQLSKFLIANGCKIIMVGDEADREIAEYIKNICEGNIVNLCGKTSISQLSSFINKSRLVVTNDSAILHLSSYLNARIVAIFGPTSDTKYTPWSDLSAVVKREIFCRPCEKAQCQFGSLNCLKLIKVEDVLKQVNGLLNTKYQIQDPKEIPNTKSQIKDYKRILIVRTDRIGDVLLSTPVIKAIRDAHPNAYIAMMVSPYAKDIVEGNPYMDEVIVFDKDVKHKSWINCIGFSLNLRNKKFDLALILHPTVRVHLVTYFSGIARRIGYNCKFGFLLTDKLKHAKQLGEKHELEYNLDLVRLLGIEPFDQALFMPIKSESESWATDLFIREELKDSDRLLGIHPGASCPSKIWPNERFAQVADKLIDKYGYKVLVIAGPKDISLAESLVKNMHNPAINLAGKTSVSQLASVLKRCRLFISNDSGPVHVACAVETPVISIFGRSQLGLSPKRWGPVGKKNKVLHKEVGCVECLAHNCQKEFACLKAITVEDVISAVEDMKKEGVAL